MHHDLARHAVVDLDMGQRSRGRVAGHKVLRRQVELPVMEVKRGRIICEERRSGQQGPWADDEKKRGDEQPAEFSSQDTSSDFSPTRSLKLRLGLAIFFLSYYRSESAAFKMVEAETAGSVAASSAIRSVRRGIHNSGNINHISRDSTLPNFRPR